MAPLCRMAERPSELRWQISIEQLELPGDWSYKADSSALNLPKVRSAAAMSFATISFESAAKLVDRISWRSFSGLKCIGLLTISVSATLRASRAGAVEKHVYE